MSSFEREILQKEQKMSFSQPDDMPEIANQASGRILQEQESISMNSLVNFVAIYST